MNCESVRNWLMQVESLQPKDWPHKVTNHLKSCAVCLKFVNSLGKMEKAWRDHPLPASCEQGKAAFLKQLIKQRMAIPARPAVRFWRPARYAAVAAMLLIGISGFGWLLFSPTPNRATASSDIVERLIDWNLELTNAKLKDRVLLLEENEARLRKELEAAKTLLTSEDYELAENLLNNGRWLATNSDLVKEAERITDIADKLAVRADSALRLGNEKDMERCGMRYSIFWARGVVPLKDKISEFKTLEFKKGFDKGAFDQMMNQQKQFEKILERSPEHSRPDLHKRFDWFHKKGPSMSKGGGKK